MRRTIITILAFLYISIACGVVVNMHYCMGKKASVAIGYNHNEGCGKCGMKNNKGCCHDEYKVVKLQDEHQPTSFSAIKELPAAILQTAEISYSAITEEHGFIARQYHSPPDPRLTEVYLQNCVFRI